jgi:phosphoribosylformylglycinamidine (FGAM) synthase PurS component
MTRTYAVTLTIPDNEAFTAFETLGRLGITVARLQRADIWQLEVEEDGAADLAARLSSIETIYNPNKHRLVERSTNEPESGEVWIATRDETPATLVAGRAIPGVRTVRRRTAWRLLDEHGHQVAPDLLTKAVETFLCNPAFQVAITR